MAASPPRRSKDVGVGVYGLVLVAAHPRERVVVGRETAVRREVVAALLAGGRAPLVGEGDPYRRSGQQTRRGRRCSSRRGLRLWRAATAGSGERRGSSEPYERDAGT